MSGKKFSIGLAAALSFAGAQACSSDATPAATDTGRGGQSTAGGTGGTSLLATGGTTPTSAGASGTLGSAGTLATTGSGGTGEGVAGGGTGGTGEGVAGGGIGGAAAGGGETGGTAGAAAGTGGTGGGVAGGGTGGSTGGSSGAGGAATAAKWSEVYKQILDPLCGSTCHNGNTSNKYGGGLDIFPTPAGATATAAAADSLRAYGNVVNQAPKPNPAANTGALAYKCTGKGMRVVKGNAAMSILYSKVHDAAPICGAVEPQAPVSGGPGTAHAPLTQVQLDMIASWINAGAQNN